MVLKLVSLLTLFRMVVIPVEFSDRAFSCSPEELQEVVRSAQDYYNAQFRSTLDFSFELAPTVTLSRGSSYYGANYSDRRDILLHEAVREACTLSAGSVDFSIYDNNGDGQVDNVALIFAGLSEADGAGNDWIWPHHDYMRNLSNTFKVGGVSVNSFTAVCELHSDAGSDPRTAGHGIFCHELGHYFGLSDLYDTDGASSGGESAGLLRTSIMDYGCLNGDGWNPPHFSAVELDFLGIGSADTLAKGSWTLDPINLSGHYLKAPGTDPDEYFLFECRSGGLAIYHIDRSGGNAGYSDFYRRDLTAAERWEYSQVNCNPDHMCVEIVSADPSAADSTGITFPMNGHDSFGSDTSPSFRWWDGSTSSLALVNIRNVGGSVSFDIVEPITMGSITAFQDAAIVGWNVDELLQDSGRLEVEWTDGTESASTTLPAGSSSCTIEGLKAQTRYRVTVRLHADEHSSYSATSTFVTKVHRSGTFPYIYLSGASRSEDGRFLPGARIPLRVFNATDVGRVTWYFNESRITAEEDGYYTLTRSGTLKAEIVHLDGTSAVIQKEITIWD